MLDAFLPTAYIYMNDLGQQIGSGNGLLPDGTKPLPEPTLTLHQRGSVHYAGGP